MKTEKIILKDAYKKFTLDQDKIVPPEKTVKRIKKKLNEIDLDILLCVVQQDQSSAIFDIIEWSVSRLSDKGIINSDGLWLLSG